jgi:hypothetical protein
VPYGSTQPLDNGDSDAARDKNRRVEFLISERGEASAPAPHRAPSYDTHAAQTSVHASTKPASVAGSVRYVLGEPVSIRRGASTMVSILNKPVAAEDAFLFRPDAHAPGSDRHPFRAVRLVNDSGYTLEPGPIAIFARGSFVGDSLIQRLDVGETAWVPYALEGGTTITVTEGNGDQPTRIVSIHRGVVEVEDQDVHTTTYTIAAGSEAAKRIYIRHAKLAGYTIRGLPPGAIDQGDAYLVPLPLQPGKTSVLALEEREPRRHTLTLLDEGATELGLYVTGSHLPAGMAEKLDAAVTLRKQMGAIEEERTAVRDRLGELSARAEEIRQNIKALDKVRGADDLRKKLVANLAQATSDGDALARQLTVQNDQIAAARAKLQDGLRELQLGDANK